MTRIAFVLLLLAALGLVGSTAMAQSAGAGRPGTARLDAPEGALGSSPEPDSLAQDMQVRRAQQLNEQRYQELKHDTDRLLQLATELKLQVDKAGEHTLSLEVIRKTDEIEKLARSVRAKMKGQ